MAFLWLPGTAVAGPLGIEMGAPLGRFAHERTATEGLYRISAPSTPDKPFETVLVVATPEQGVCAVVLVAPHRSFDSAGAGVRAIMAHQVRLLSQTFGRPELVDRLAGGAVLTQPTDFAAALHAGQRELAAVWKGAGEAALAGDVYYGDCRTSLNGLLQVRTLLGR